VLALASSKVPQGLLLLRRRFLLYDARWLHPLPHLHALVALYALLRLLHLRHLPHFFRLSCLLHFILDTRLNIRPSPHMYFNGPSEVLQPQST
jgi:hypothetical protein